MKKGPTRGLRKAWGRPGRANPARNREVCSISKGVKALIAVVAVAVISASAYYFIGTGPKSQKEPVKAALESFFSEVKEGRLEEAGEYVVPGSEYTDILSKFDSGQYEDTLKLVLSKIQYRIDGIEIEGSAASAQLHIESVDLFSFYNRHTEELNPMLEDYISGSAAEKERVMDRFKEFVSKQIPDDIDSGDYDISAGDVEVNLVMKDGKWLIDADDSLLYYLTGKMTLLLQ